MSLRSAAEDTPSPRARPMQPARRWAGRLRRAPVPILRALLVLAAVSAGCSGPQQSDVDVPEVDVAGYEPRARRLIEERLAAARARPNDGEALGMAAMALHAYQVLEPAAQAYRLASDRAPAEYRWHYLLGVVASQLGRLAEAEDAVRTAAGLAQGHLFVRLRLAGILLEAGKPEEALGLYDRAASAQAGSMAAHLGRGSALARLGRSEEALAALERAATFGDDYRPLHYRLALALRAADREAEAAHFMGLYERLDPAPRTPFRDPLVQQIEELRAGSFRHHLNRGIRFETAGRLEEAVREYSLAARAEPGQAHAYVNLISAYGKLGRHEDAEAAYLEAISRSSGIEEAHYNYAVVLSLAGRHTEAEAAYREALGVNPYSADARLNLGDALEQQGRPAEAAEQFRRVLQLSPGHRLASFRLGMSLYRQDRWNEALAHLRRAVDVRDSETAQFLMVLARAERNAGNSAEATRRAAEARRMAQEHGLTEFLAILDREFPSSR